MFKKTAAELLFAKKDDFDRVLRASRQKQWDEIRSALKQFPYFTTWEEATIKECCMLSDTITFSPQQIVLGKDIGKQASVHFVLSGTCALVQRLMVTRGPKGGISLLPLDASEQSIEPLFVQVCLFTQGASFNLGESLLERTVVADTEVRLMRIPLYLLQQHNTANIWHRIRQFLESRLPNDRQLFRHFLETQRWRNYRQKLCATLRSTSAPHPTSLHDVPYYCRVLHLTPSSLQLPGK